MEMLTIIYSKKYERPNITMRCHQGLIIKCYLYVLLYIFVA